MWAERGRFPSIGLRLAGAALVSLLAWPAAGVPPTSPRPAVGFQIELPRLVELDSIGGRDLLATGNAPTNGLVTGLSFDLGSYGAAGASRPQALRARVVRRVEKLWRVALDGSTKEPDAHEVRVELIAPDGTLGALGVAGEPSAKIAIRAVPLNPVRIEEGGTAFLQGGVELELDLATARQAGRYEGAISVTVIPR